MREDWCWGLRRGEEVEGEGEGPEEGRKEMKRVEMSEKGKRKWKE